MKRLPLLVIASIPLFTMAADPKNSPFNGRIERFDPAFDKLIATDAQVEKLAEGFTW